MVYNQDSSRLLQHAIDTAEGRHPEPLLSELGVVLPPMPQRGEVDFIYGGKTFSTCKQPSSNICILQDHHVKVFLG